MKRDTKSHSHVNAKQHQVIILVWNLRRSCEFSHAKTPKVIPSDQAGNSHDHTKFICYHT